MGDAVPSGEVNQLDGMRAHLLLGRGRLRTVSRNVPVIRRYDAQRPGAGDDFGPSESS